MLKPVKYDENIKKRLLDRSKDEENVEEKVKAIIEDVKQNKDEALKKYSALFDKVTLSSFAVTKEEMEEALQSTDEAFIETLERCAANIEEFHTAQKRRGFEIKRGLCIVGEKFIPVQSAGIYVPGGTAAYPSTVLMNAIPAKVAGVERIVMVTPPQKDGKIRKEVLAAAKIAGVTEIYKVGGAQAIAALAFGTESIEKTDVITGPGNIYVATAKRLIYGKAGIDMVAGPSEILIVADEFAKAENVAADLLSQAEHDTMASAILVTPSEKLADNVAVALEKRLKNLDRYEIAKKSIEDNCMLIVCDNIDQAIEISDEFAPEHLELAVKNPFALMVKVKNAGSVFMGYNTPEAIGDYYAGANHTLPTGGTARFSSPLSVDDFQKATQYMYYDKEDLYDAADDIISFAQKEGLTAHAESIKVRVKRK